MANAKKFRQGRFAVRNIANIDIPDSPDVYGPSTGPNGSMFGKSVKVMPNNAHTVKNTGPHGGNKARSSVPKHKVHPLKLPGAGRAIKSHETPSSFGSM